MPQRKGTWNEEVGTGGGTWARTAAIYDGGDDDDESRSRKPLRKTDRAIPEIGRTPSKSKAEYTPCLTQRGRKPTFILISRQSHAATCELRLGKDCNTHTTVGEALLPDEP